MSSSVQMLIPVKRWRTEASLSISLTPSLYPSLALSLSPFCTDSCYSTLQRGPRWAVGGGETVVVLRRGGQKRQSNLKTLWMIGWSSAARRAERGVAGVRRTEDKQERRWEKRRGGRWGLTPALGMQNHTVRQIGASDGKRGTGYWIRAAHKTPT